VILPLTCFTTLLLAQAVPPQPNDVAWQADRSIERDSVVYYRALWEGELARVSR
jgi:hypothetical protein